MRIQNCQVFAKKMNMFNTEDVNDCNINSVVLRLWILHHPRDSLELFIFFGLATN